MRASLRLILGMLLSLLAMAPALGQNPLQVDAPHFKLEYEDDKVRVIRFRLMPGQKSPLHEHATRITVVVSGSRLKIEDTDGATSEINVYTGAADRQIATRHTVENVGEQPYEELTTEFKDAASQPPKLVVKAAPPPPPAPKPEKPKKKKDEPKVVAAQPSTQPSTPTSTPEVKVAKVEPKKPESKKADAKALEAAAQKPPVVEAAAEPPAPPMPEPIIKPLKTRPPDAVIRKSRRAFVAESMSEANVNNTRLAFMEQGKGVPVVFVHGAMGDYRSWQLQIPAAAKGYRVISYSRRYHYPNPSTGKEEDYTYESNVKDLADFLAALNVGPVHLVGHGYGAAVAAMLAERHPELVRSLVLSEPGFDQLLDAKRAYRTRWARDEIFNVIRKPLSKQNPEKGVQVYHDWIAETESWNQLDAQEQYERKQNANALRTQTIDPNPPAFTCEDAKKIKAPTLVIAGQNRSPNSAEITGTLAACLANSERATISNAGPAAYLDNAEEYNQVLLQFLQKR
ncbi:MAG TPA: alpha/beta fold hydrolase [Terriglobales bacterium]|nr:alpha/beta fold hydrolase [Terriglobales bacterium]